MSILSDQDYWEKLYLKDVSSLTDLPDIKDFRATSTRKILELLESNGIIGKNILEIGAGDSSLLLLLANRFAGQATFYGLDYTRSGCELLQARARNLKLDVNVIQADLFQPPRSLFHKFDVVYTMGLVEHFAHLEEILAALAKFLKTDGIIVNIIPNMHGILGLLTRRWNQAVYDIHNPHNLSSFQEGHLKANLQILQSGYLCSSNFGVLSSCFQDKHSRGYRSYVQLSRLSKAIWWLESWIGRELPKTSWLSPYIFAISQSPKTERTINRPVLSDASISA